jgi:hypothetical protein
MIAACRWPKAAWVFGDGPYATLSHCPPFGCVLMDTDARKAGASGLAGDCPRSVTVRLCGDFYEAESYANSPDDEWACEGNCFGSEGHRVIDLRVA